MVVAAINLSKTGHTNHRRARTAHLHMSMINFCDWWKEGQPRKQSYVVPPSAKLGWRRLYVYYIMIMGHVAPYNQTATVLVFSMDHQVVKQTKQETTLRKRTTYHHLPQRMKTEKTISFGHWFEIWFHHVPLLRLLGKRGILLHPVAQRLLPKMQSCRN